MSNELINKTILDTYLILTPLSNGSFGSVYQGINIITNQPLAIKVELKSLTNQRQSLQSEYDTLLRINHPSIPQPIAYAEDNTHRFLVEEQLGRSLEDLFEHSSRQFSLRTVCALTIEMIGLIRFVHASNLIHCDVKPANFTYDKRRLHLIDFGLANEYRSDSNKTHIPFKKGYNLIGTAKYCSIHSHKGYELSRRDDMESIGYMVVYFLKGRLPWQGLKGEDWETWLERIERVKSRMSSEELCKDLPSQVEEYMRYVKGLEFKEEPEYDYLIGLFQDIIRSNGFTYDDSDSDVLEVYTSPIEKDTPIMKLSKSQNSTLTDSHDKEAKKERSKIEASIIHEDDQPKLSSSRKKKNYQTEDEGLNKCSCIIF